jgi:hypothetical protein
MLSIFNSRAKERKGWLFCCACCRAIWHLLSEDCQRRLELVEGFVDGRVTEQELRQVFTNWYPSESVLEGATGGFQAACAVATLGDSWRWNREVPRWSADRVSRESAEAAAKTVTWDEARDAQIQLFREVLGNPFRPAIIDPDWLAWNNRTVVKLATTIYQDRRWEIMPILGDALEDAMCDNSEILEHCRGPRPHARGCWVVDLILGKS